MREMGRISLGDGFVFVQTIVLMEKLKDDLTVLTETSKITDEVLKT